MLQELRRAPLRTFSLSGRCLLTLALLLAAVQSGRAQTFRVLYSFAGPDGAAPHAGLILDTKGNLYGTTELGGSYSYGVVFKLAPSGKQTVLYNFTGGADGGTPLAGLVRDAKGNFYGTTYSRGSSYQGVVFKLTQKGKQTVLHTFTGHGGDGSSPVGTLVRDAKGNLYGTTQRGGSNGLSGTVYRLDRTGKETVLHSFIGAPTDGEEPDAGLVQDLNGNLYGTTYLGGDSDSGVVFKVNAVGHETVLHSFTGHSDGRPMASLIRDTHGTLYGTTSEADGTVFKLGKRGKEKVLYQFGGTSDGNSPYAGLSRDAQGNIYGTTFYGGYQDNGVVFKLDSAGNETVLYTFTGGSDGGNPFAGVILDTQGNLYGTTYHGGAYGGGTVFKLTP